jgi:DNA-binding PadR family transcriptional regulator
MDKRTNYYELTERGKQAVADRCEWEQQYTEVAVSSP